MGKGVNKIKGFTGAELTKYEGLYSKIMFAVDKIQGFLPDDVYQGRRYVAKLDDLRNYIAKIKDAHVHTCDRERNTIYKYDDTDIQDNDKNDKNYR